MHKYYSVSVKIGAVSILSLLLVAFFAKRVFSPADTRPKTQPVQTVAPSVPDPSPVPPPVQPQSAFPWHGAITATVFYVGETATDDNGHIPNAASTWDENWQTHFGGVDTPNKRNGWFPAGFTPKENPFYVALPYNDLTEDGVQKASAKSVDWYARSQTSLVKNRWIQVCYKGTCAYGQWEDAGPYGEDDVAYVFGSAAPKNKRDVGAGIDLSPALAGYLKLGDVGQISWRFVSETEVTAGPWQQIITRSN